jgi:DNA (cytosine-5)-methyltransferase 1
VNELALFAGAGGGILGGHLLGWRTVCAVEFDPYARDVLVARQNDGCLPPFPIWDDVRTFDGRPWRGVVDVVSGGFPCQDISQAGTTNGLKGLDGERSGLWSEMRRIIHEVRPRFVLVENSPMLTIRGLGVILGELAALGFDAAWGVFSAADVGARHERERMWIVAESNQVGPLPDMQEDNAMEGGRKIAPFRREDWIQPEMVSAMCGTLDAEWKDFPDAARDADAVADWVDRLKATGNGQVPAVVRLAWETLMGLSMHNSVIDVTSAQVKKPTSANNTPDLTGYRRKVSVGVGNSGGAA